MLMRRPFFLPAHGFPIPGDPERHQEGSPQYRRTVTRVRAVWMSDELRARVTERMEGRDIALRPLRS